MSLSSIRTLLINDSAISTIVGDKIAVGFIQQETEAPFILLEEGERDPNNCKNETSTLDQYTILVTAVDPRYKGVEALVSAVRSVLDGHSDASFTGIKFSGQRDHYDGVSQDYHLKTYSFKTLLKS